MQQRTLVPHKALQCKVQEGHHIGAKHLCIAPRAKVVAHNSRCCLTAPPYGVINHKLLDVLPANGCICYANGDGDAPIHQSLRKVVAGAPYVKQWAVPCIHTPLGSCL